MLLAVIVAAGRRAFGTLGYVACDLSAVIAHGRWPTLGGQRLVVVIARLSADRGGPTGRPCGQWWRPWTDRPDANILWGLPRRIAALGMVGAVGRLRAWAWAGNGRLREPLEVRRTSARPPTPDVRASCTKKGNYADGRPPTGRIHRPRCGQWAPCCGRRRRTVGSSSGPTRSGKTMRVLVRTILDAPGPVVTTSIRLDTLTLTAPARAKVGPVSVFDPLGTTGWPTTMHWSPIRGCEDPLARPSPCRRLCRRHRHRHVPRRRRLLGSSGGQSHPGVPARCRPRNSHTRRSIVVLTRPPIPAQSPSCVDTTTERPGAGPTCSNRRPIAIRDNGTRCGQWWKPLSTASAITEWPQPARTRDSHSISPNFLRHRGTLYAVGSVDEQELLAPLVTAMLEDVTAEARNVARRSPHGRLQPFLTAAIDEAATIAPLPSLPTMIASDGGNGITTLMVLQVSRSGSQALGAPRRGEPCGTPRRCG